MVYIPFLLSGAKKARHRYQRKYRKVSAMVFTADSDHASRRLELMEKPLQTREGVNVGTAQQPSATSVPKSLHLQETLREESK